MKKVLLDFEDSTFELADKAVELSKPEFASRRQFIEISIRKEAERIISENSRDSEVNK